MYIAQQVHLRHSTFKPASTQHLLMVQKICEPAKQNASPGTIANLGCVMCVLQAILLQQEGMTYVRSVRQDPYPIRPLLIARFVSIIVHQTQNPNKTKHINQNNNNRRALLGHLKSMGLHVHRVLVAPTTLRKGNTM